MKQYLRLPCSGWSIGRGVHSHSQLWPAPNDRTAVQWILRDDFGLAFMMLRVEDFVLDAPLVEQAGKFFALLDRHGADQDRAAWVLDLGNAVA